MKIIKWLLGTGACFILALCFVWGMLDGMAREDALRDKIRQERCENLPWPRPADCALLNQQLEGKNNEK